MHSLVATPAPAATLVASVQRKGTAGIFSTGCRRAAALTSRSHRAVQMESSQQQQQAHELSRRSHLLGVCSLISVANLPAFAGEAAELEAVNDPVDAFSISIPKGWTSGQGEIGADSGGIAAAATRRALAWFPEDRPEDVNVTLVITNTAADFTSLSSFGSDYDFGTNLVNSMDRSYLLRGPKWARKGVNEEDIQISKLISTKSVNSGYLIEYTVQNAKVDKHLTSFVFLGFNGRYNRLYTITAQCPKGELSAFADTFQAICKSFKAPLVA